MVSDRQAGPEASLLVLADAVELCLRRVHRAELSQNPRQTLHRAFVIIKSRVYFGRQGDGGSLRSLLIDASSAVMVDNDLFTEMVNS